MRVSVIISTYNSPEWLEKVLWGYAAQTTGDFEVMIADDGSTAETALVIERMRRKGRLYGSHLNLARFAGRGSPRPVAGRSLRATAFALSPPSRRRHQLTVAGQSPAYGMPCAHSMPAALARAPPLPASCLRLPPTPAPGAWTTPP